MAADEICLLLNVKLVLSCKYAAGFHPGPVMPSSTDGVPLNHKNIFNFLDVLNFAKSFLQNYLNFRRNQLKYFDSIIV